MSFRRHEEELLRTDITQDDLVLSVNSCSILRKSAELGSVHASKEFPKCDASLLTPTPNMDGYSAGDCIVETEDGNADLGQGKPSLQDLFNTRMKKFIEASKQRQEKVQNLATVTPKEVGLV